MISEKETFGRVLFMEDLELRESLLEKLKELTIYREHKGITIKKLLYICIGVSAITLLILFIQIYFLKICIK